MRMHGYCEECRRPRPVKVNMGRWLGGIPTGICVSCEQKADAKRGGHR